MPTPLSFFGYGAARYYKKKQLAVKYNIPLNKIIDLSSGNNLFIPSEYIQSLVAKEIRSFDPRDNYSINFQEYIEELARFFGLPYDFFYAGISHNQLIYRVIDFVCSKNDNIVLLSPEKDIFHRLCKTKGLNIHEISLASDFTFDVNQFIERVNKIKPKLVLFSSPHYPSGNQFSEDDVIALAKNIRSLILIDESYVEFGKYSLVNQVPYFSNLIIVRTFSKAWGLGAFSSAYLISSSGLISKLKKWFFMEEIPPLHILITKRILQSPYRFVERINAFIKERKRVIENLQMMNTIRVFKSDTNFLFIKHVNVVSSLYEQFCSKGIMIKTFEHYTFPNHKKYFLVTLGTPKINDRFIVALAEILETIS